MPVTFVKITLDTDTDAENPLKHDGWVLHTFGNHHDITYCDPYEYIKPNPDNRTIPANRNIARKLKSGLAHWVSRFAHGQEQWGLVGEVHQCPWDTVQIAGILVWEHKWHELGPMDYEWRKEDARKTLRSYTRWVNGEAIRYSIDLITVDKDDFDPEVDDLDLYDHHEEHISSCGGYLDYDYMRNKIANILQHSKLSDLPIVYEGDAK